MTIRHSKGQYEVVPTAMAATLANLPSDVAIFTDRNVYDAFGDVFPEGVATNVLPAGEATKSLEWFGKGLGWLAQAGASRKTTVVAVGGGVVGDLVGFLAAAYMRGVAYLQVPTTLLAMVDSSVGGKVAVDLPEGKNLAGAFWPPSEVRLPIDALERLPERQLANGMAEVLKYGFIMDPGLLGGFENLEAVVMRCVELKAQIVEEDEYETTGRRAILNFGHTIGHAIERLTGYGPVLHGEAISVGMALEADLGEALGITPSGTAAKVREALGRQGLPLRDPATHRIDEMLACMRGDKKASGGRLAFSLLTQLGDCTLITDVPEADVRRVLEAS